MFTSFLLIMTVINSMSLFVGRLSIFLLFYDWNQKSASGFGALANSELKKISISRISFLVAIDQEVMCYTKK